MKIAVWHNLPSGGGKRAFYNHVRGLVSRGHDLTIWSPPTADRQYLPLNSIAPEIVLPFVPATALAWPLEWLLKAARTKSDRLRAMSAMLVHAEKFAETIATGHFDVVFVNSCQIFMTPFAGRYLSQPRVLYLQEPYRPLFEATPSFPWVAEEPPAYEWWDPRSLRHWLGDAARTYASRVQTREELKNGRCFDRVLVNSKYSRESVLRAHGGDASVCYLGIDSERFTFSDEAREDFVLSVGELIDNKRPQFIIRSVAASKSRPRLVWVANRAIPDCRLECEMLAQSLGIDLEIHIGISEAELVSFYQRAAAFLYAPRLEPFGFAPLEANACGTPVIGIAEAGVRETVVDGHNGLLVDLDALQFGDAIDQLMSNAARARSLGRNGAADVRQHWSLEASTSRLETHLAAVAARASSPPRTVIAQ
jgi:glycosyltransferase involved in cell wall biosynthesis